MLLVRKLVRFLKINSSSEIYIIAPVELNNLKIIISLTFYVKKWIICTIILKCNIWLLRCRYRDKKYQATSRYLSTLRWLKSILLDASSLSSNVSVKRIFTICPCNGYTMRKLYNKPKRSELVIYRHMGSFRNSICVCIQVLSLLTIFCTLFWLSTCVTVFVLLFFLKKGPYSL